MHRFIFGSLIIFTISFDVYSADHTQMTKSEEYTELSELSEKKLKVGEVLAILENQFGLAKEEGRWHEVRKTLTTLKKMGIRNVIHYGGLLAMPFFAGAGFFEILGGVGYHFTCDHGGYEAAKFLCGTSIISLSLGAAIAVAGVAAPVVFIIFNRKEIEEVSVEQLVQELQGMDDDADLPEDLARHILLINAKKD